MIFLLFLIMNSFLNLQASNHSTNDETFNIPGPRCLDRQAPDTATQHSTSQLQKPKTQQERDDTRYARYTCHNIRALEHEYPNNVLPKEKDSAICQQLHLWDARIAYQRRQIQTSPQDLVDLYSYLEPLYIKKTNPDGSTTKSYINPDDLATMKPDQLQLVCPAPVVDYLLNLPPERTMSFAAACRFKRSLERAQTEREREKMKDQSKKNRSRSTSPMQQRTPQQPAAERISTMQVAPTIDQIQQRINTVIDKIVSFDPKKTSTQQFEAWQREYITLTATLDSKKIPE